ncbi:S-layer homology domain-containing protein [Cohnella fermenti]|nr:S-layer homology domain-containing protein [Cohnella fermenti]
MRKIIKGRGSALWLKWLWIASLLAGLLEPIGARAGAAVSHLNDAALSDIAGHWAEEPMAEWASAGLIQGFADGTLRPDDIITRVQFIALVNRLFGLQGEEGAAAFGDVSAGAWFASDVNAAVQAGYVHGFPDRTFRPDKPLQRIEAVTMLTALVPTIADEAAGTLERFKDISEVPGYGRASLEAAVASGLLQGLPDGTVRPLKSMTRAEAVVLLDRIRQGADAVSGSGIVPGARVVTEAGTYGPSAGVFTVGGNLEVGASGTTLRNVVVKGDLTILPSVGEGDVYLHNVEVEGSTFIQGGGRNSVHIDNSVLGTVVIDKSGGLVRVVVDGATVIAQLDVQSDAGIESPQGMESGIAGITILSSGEVKLSGEFGHVEVRGGVKLTVAAGSVANLVVNEEVSGVRIELADGVHVERMTLRGATDVTGAGTIGTAIVDSADVAFENEPATKEVTEKGSSGSAAGGGVSTGPGSSPSPEPTTSPEPAESPEPTEPTESPEPADTAVEAAVSQASATGFRLALSVPVPALAATDILLRDSAGTAVAVGTPTTIDGGTAYRIPAVLTEGTTYTLAIFKPGYDFGAELTFAVPVTPPPIVSVNASPHGISSAGFSVTLDTSVPGLTSANFTLVNLLDNAPIALGQPSTEDGGSYTFSAALEEGQTYSLSIAKEGYDFGSAVAIYVEVHDPEIIAVQATITASAAEGFTVSLSPPIEGLTASDFAIIPNAGGEAVPASGAATNDEGASYVIEAALTEGVSYTIAIVLDGYSFGAALSLVIPVSYATVQATISQVSTAGFIVTLDQTVPELDALNFVLSRGASQVGIDMLSPVQTGRQYEVWSTLSKGETYALTLDKEGYAFAGGSVEWTVEPSRLQADIVWITHEAVKLRLSNGAVQLPFVAYSLEDEDGNSVAIGDIRTEDDGRSIVIQAGMAEAGNYHYRIDLDDDHYVEGTVAVQEAPVVTKYTTFEPSNSGITVYLDRPVPGLVLGDFLLTDTSDVAVAIDEASTADGGNSYYLRSADMQYKSLILAISHEGYDFGEPVNLIRTTLGPYYAGVGSNKFMAGLSPAVPGLTADNFRIVNADGQAVPILNVSWDSYQGYYVVQYDGPRGLPYTFSVVKSGYDFGESASIALESEYKIDDISGSGFTFILDPPTAINTVNGFEVRRSDGSLVRGVTATTADGGASYRVSANLTPGDYTLQVAAALSRTSFSFNVPAYATIAVDQVTDTGLRVSLDWSLDGLWAGSFAIVRADTEEGIWIQDATTEDGGRTYRLTADLPEGLYNVKLIGHLPEAGVDFAAGASVDAGAATVGQLSNSGFLLSFENAVAGLTPADLELRNGQNGLVGGVMLSTADGGLTYRVNVALVSNSDYTLTLSKSYVKFGSPIAFHVPYFVTGTIVELTPTGDMAIAFDPPMPQLENGWGIVFTDAGGNRIFPGTIEMTEGGRSFRLPFPNLAPGQTYSMGINVTGYEMTPVSFMLPAGYSVSQASSSGVTVEFAAPIPDLAKGQFVLRDSTGAEVKIGSAATTDDGSIYVLSAALVPGQYYTLQVKPALLYQQYQPITFAVMKEITAKISSLKQGSLKLTFSEKVKNLTSEQLVFRDAGGWPIASNEYYVGLTTADQGLTYQLNFSFPYAGNGNISIELIRPDFKLKAPVTFSIPKSGSIWLFGTFAGQIMFGINPNPDELTIDHVKLTDSKGKSVAASLRHEADEYYSLLGDFAAAETYYMSVAYPGYDYGDPLVIGVEIKSDAWIYAESQDGFKLKLFPGIPDLAPSDVIVTDEAGNRTAVQSLTSVDGGLNYQVKVPMSGKHSYSVSIIKSGYLVRLTQTLALVTRMTSIEHLSTGGLTLNLSSRTQLAASDIALLDDNGEAVAIRGFASWDGGYSYEITADLKTDRSYMLHIAKSGYYFGTPPAIFIKSVQTAFGGMAPGSNNAFVLQLSEPLPGLKASDFKLRRASDGSPLPVLVATTEDGGSTYVLEASFWGGESYTVVPFKDGYDFGNPVPVNVPVFASAALLEAGVSGFVVGLNPGVAGMDAGHFTVRNSVGDAIPVLGVTEEDAGERYRVQANLPGGETYEVTLSRSGYVFEPSLSFSLPTTIASEVLSASETGIRIGLTPGVSGLSKAAFVLKDSAGGIVAIEEASTNDGGNSYLLKTVLEGGKTYSLQLAAEGYDFGSMLSASVPIPISLSITDPNADGFVVALDAPVPGLTVSNIILQDGAGAAVAVSSVKTTDGGATYAVKAELTEGAAYSLIVVRSGYDFGRGTPVDVPLPPPEPPVAMTVTETYSDRFTLHLGESVRGLTAANLQITDELGQAVTPTDVNDRYDTGIDYWISMPIVSGKVYTVELIDSNRESEGPVEVYLELNAYPVLLAATRDGITLRLSSVGTIDLRLNDIAIYAEDGSEVAVTGLKQGQAAGTYTIQAYLAEGNEYRFELQDRKATVFDWQSNPNEILVPIKSTVTAERVNLNGFDLAFTTPVSGLSVTIYNGNSVFGSQPDSVVSTDGGRTYQVRFYFAYNSTYRVRIASDGYDLGEDINVTNVSLPPALLTAATDPGGRKVVLGFDMELSSVPADAPFSVKINNKWQSGVQAARVAGDSTKVELTWSASGAVITSDSTVQVAYTGIQRVQAVNTAYLVSFDALDVANVATTEGFVRSFPADQDAAPAAYGLHTTYGRTALETAKLLREAGFARWNYARAVKAEYDLDTAGFIALMSQMNVDASMMFEALIDVGGDGTFMDALSLMIAAGYTASDLAPLLRDRGYQSKEIGLRMKQAGVSASDVAGVLRDTFKASASSAAAVLKAVGYSLAEIGDTVQAAYKLTNGEAAQALKSAGYSASDTLAFIRERYAAGGTNSVLWLIGAGYTANEAGTALGANNPFADAAEAAVAFVGAELAPSDIYVLVRQLFGGNTAASAMLAAGIEASEVARAVQAGGETPAVAVSALLTAGVGVKPAATYIADAWGNTSAALASAMNGFAASGIGIVERASLLLGVYGADIGPAIAALNPAATAAERGAMMSTLVSAGYDRVAVTAYYLNSVYNGRRADALGLLVRSGVSIDESLSLIRSAVVASGAAFTLQDAVTVFRDSYDGYTADEVVKALMTTFAQAQEDGISAQAIAKEMTDANRWGKLDITRSLIARMGVTLAGWVELERSDAFSRYGCPCSISTIVNESRYLFSGATIEQIAAAMSQSELFTLDELIDGLIGSYQMSSSYADALPRLTATLKDSGYPFVDIAAAFDERGWSDWIMEFSRYGIAASEVVAYLKSISVSDADIVQRLEPYALGHIVLALRTELGKDEAEATALLTSRYDTEDVAYAVTFAYGGDPVTLWIKTLRSQNATAISVINTISARFSNYRDAAVVGPALIRGGYEVNEVMAGLLLYTKSNGNLQATVSLLKTLYSEEQVSISNLLSASGSETPESGITFLKNAGFGISSIARGLKEYYGLASGKASALLIARYPNDIGSVLNAIAWAYDASFGESVEEALAEQGITTVEEAIPYLGKRGFSFEETVGAVKDGFGLSAGEAASRFAALNQASVSVLLNTISVVYNQSPLVILYEWQAAGGTASFQEAVGLGYSAGISLSGLVVVARDYYKISSGSAFYALTESHRYSNSQITAAIASLYPTSEKMTVAESLQSKGLLTLGEAVPYLRTNRFELRDVVRVGRDYYGLSGADTAVVLDGTGFYTLRQIQNEVAAVYEVPLEQAVAESLIALGKTSFAEAIPTFWGMDYELPALASIAKLYYQLDEGAAVVALQQSGYFSLPDIVEAVTLEYGKPTDETISAMLTDGGYATFPDALPFLLNNQIELRNIIRAGRNHYGLTGAAVSAALVGTGFYTLSQVQTEVAYVYDQPLDQVIVESLGGLGIDSFDQAIPELWKKDLELFKIAKVAKGYYHLKASEAIYTLQQSGLYGLTNIITAVAGQFGKPTEETMAALLAGSGIDKLEDGVYLLQQMGYSVQDIVTAAKEQYGLSSGDSAIKLAELGVAGTEIIQWAVSSVYEQSAGATAIDYIQSGGIRSVADAIVYMCNAGVTLLDMTKTIQSYYGETPVRLGSALIESDLFQLPVILQSIDSVFTDSTDSLVAIMTSNGYTDYGDMVDNLRLAGIRIEEIARAMKLRFGVEQSELRLLLERHNAYDESAIEQALEAAYSAERENERLATAMMKEVMTLNDIQTAEGAIAFMKNAGTSLSNIVTYLKEQYGLTAPEATTMLKPYYRLIEIGLATTEVYLANGNLKYISGMMDPLDVSDSPISLARFMYKKFIMSDIIAALKWFYGLDAQQTLQAFAGTDIPKDEYTKAVVAYYGDDVLFDYLASLKAGGATSGAIATELDNRKLLETVNIVYLANLLKSLGYDLESILSTSFHYFSSGKGRPSTEEDQAAMFVALGYTRPLDIVDGLRNYAGYVNSAAYAFRVFTTVHLALPNASMSEIATAMKKLGYDGTEILNVLDHYEVRDDSIVPYLKSFGYNAQDAYLFLNGRTLENKIYWMVKNGYALYDYLKYLNYSSTSAISILRANGLSANEIGYTLGRYYENSYWVGKYLYDGGVTNLKDLAGAMLASGSYPSWVIDDLQSLGYWPLKEIAQSMLDSEMLSLVELVYALRYATNEDLTQTYQIVREVSKQEQKEFYNSLSDAERKILGNDEIAVLVTLSALRSANIGVEKAAEQIRSTERLGFEMGGVLLTVSGYGVGDVLEALWNVYRNEIGILILKTMIGQTISKVLTELQDYYKLGNLVYKIVKKTTS